ncbi:MAG: serine/threonine-protein kinase [Mycobacterium sp.]|uniref:serine/threonine-protein kinase n=1 Tax=Mycobacterium sp. TaxID=1785 RepID=UPI003F9C985E
MALASGATFAGYVIARRLGSGATGDVYLVQDPRSARWRALKVLSQAMSTDAEFRRRFQAETPAAANLRHPHIVAVDERGEFHGRLYLAMEYVEGLNAAQLMADRFPAVSPAGEVLAIVTAVAGALDYAHERWLLHRDVRPANILLTGRGEGTQRILLSDFGIVRRPPAGANRGTVGYAAPEEFTGVGVDGRADQYALAATAFHLLTGAPPEKPAERLSDQRPELARLDAVFARALAGSPADRFATCRDFAEAAREHAGVSIADRRPDTVVVAEYPAYARPAIEDTKHITSAARVGSAVRKPASRGAAPRSAAGSPARLRGGSAAARSPGPHTGAPPDAPKMRRARSVLLGAAAAVLGVMLIAFGFVIGRTTGASASRAALPSSPVPSALPPAPAAIPAAPVPLDGSYRLQVQRSKQTFNYVADPQPPDVNTWWAFRSTCNETACTAAAMQLDDGDHQQAAAAAGRQLIMRFIDGRWQSQPEDVQVACVGPDELTQTQATTVVLSLRPQPRGEFVGEETVTVQTNECGQRSAVMRIPAVLSRRGDVPPAVTGLDPETAIPNTPAPPGMTTSGPHR